EFSLSGEGHTVWEAGRRSRPPRSLCRIVAVRLSVLVLVLMLLVLIGRGQAHDLARRRLDQEPLRAAVLGYLYLEAGRPILVFERRFEGLASARLLVGGDRACKRGLAGLELGEFGAVLAFEQALDYAFALSANDCTGGWIDQDLAFTILRERFHLVAEGSPLLLHPGGDRVAAAVLLCGCHGLRQ